MYGAIWILAFFVGLLVWWSVREWTVISPRFAGKRRTAWVSSIGPLAGLAVAIVIGVSGSIGYGAWQNHRNAVLAQEAAAEAARQESERLAKLQAAEEEKRKAEECRKDIQCWGDKYSFGATASCKKVIPTLAKYTHEWTDSWSEVKFPRFRWADEAKGTVTYLGDKIRFQNGFGAWQNMTYLCTYDPQSGKVLDAKATPGHLPAM